MASTASLLGTKRKRGASASAAEVVRCICSTSADDGQEMIECDGCKVWQHTDCVGARAGQLSWRCERCDPRPPAQLAAMVAQARARRGMDVGPADEYVPLADDDLRALQPQLPELGSWRPRLALEHAQAVPPPGYAAEPRRLAPGPGGQMCFAASYGLFARVRRERGDLLARFVAVVTRAADYLADPINMYPSLMLPKPYVHLLPAPTPLALDARRAGGEARFARCGCRPNAELVPAHVGPARQLVFVLVATRDIASGDEIVLPWEWDDMHPVHRLVRATPQTTNSANLRAHIASFLSAAEGFIPPCACTDPSTCLFVAMRRYAAAEHPLSPHPLPPLPKRGLAAVPRQGFGQGAVLLPPTSTTQTSTSSPDASSLWLPTPSTSPHTTFLSIASALHLHIQPDPAEQRLPHRMRKTHIRRLFDELKGVGAFERGRVWDPVGAVTVRKVGAAPNAGGAGSRSASAARSGSVASGVRANGAGGGGGKKRGKMDVLSLLADGGGGAGGGGAHTANGHTGDVPVTPLAALSLERERERRPLSPAFPSAPAPERPLSPAFPEPKPPPPEAAQTEAEAAGAQAQSQGGAAPPQSQGGAAPSQAQGGAAGAQDAGSSAPAQAQTQPQIDPALMAIDSPAQPAAEQQMDVDPAAPPPPAPPAPPQPGRRTTFSAWLRNRKVHTASVGAGGEGVVLSPGGVVESPGGIGASEPGAGFGVGAGASEPGGVDPGSGAGAGAEDVAMPEPGEVLPGELVRPPAEGGVPEPGEVRPGEDEDAQQQTREKQAHEDAVTSIIEEALGWRQPSGGPSRLQEIQPQRRPSGEQRRPSGEQERRLSGEQQRRPSGEQQRRPSGEQRSASRDQPPMQRFPQPPEHLRPSSRERPPPPLPGMQHYPPAEQRRPYDPPRSPPPGQGHRGPPPFDQRPPHDSRQLHRPPSPRPPLNRPPYDQRPPSPRAPFDPLHRPPYDQRPYPPDAYQQQHGPPYDAGRSLYHQERPPHDQTGPYDPQRRPFEHAPQRPGPYDHARRPSFGQEQQQGPPYEPHHPPLDEQHLQRPPFEHQQRSPGPFDHPQRAPYEQRPPSHSRHPSASATPRHPSATMTPRHSSAAAQHPSAATPQHNSAATPRHPSAAMTPRHPSAAATPQHPSAAATPQHNSATRRDSQMMVDEQAANANASASASDSPGEDAPPPATRSPQSDTTAPPPQTPEEEGEVVRVKSEEGWAAVPGDAVVVVPAKRARSPSSSAGSTTKTPRRFGRFNQQQGQLQNPHDRRLPEHRRASAGLADRRASGGPPNRRVSGGMPYGEVERYQPPYRDFGGPSPTRDKFGGPPPPPPGPGRDFHHLGPGPGPGRHPDFPQREYAPDFGRGRDYGRPPPPPPLPPAERTHGWGTSPPRDWAAAAGAWEEREREQRERSRAWGGERFADEPPPPPMPHHSGWAPPPDAPYDYERGPPPPPPPPNQPRTWGDYDAVGYPHRDRGRFGNGAPSAPRAMRGYP